MNEPKTHHYVPMVYQKRFANNRGLLWVYDRAKKQFAERHPKVICCENDLYAVKPPSARKDQRLESLALAQADGDCATGIRTLLAPLSGRPGHYVASLVAYFVGLQYSRVPSMREFVTTVWERNTKETMRLMAVNEGRMQSVIDEYEQSTGGKIEVSAQTMVEVIHRGGLRIVVSEVPFLRYVFDTANIVAATVIRSSWQVLRAPPEKDFILCDAPVVVVPPRGVRRVGFLVPGTVTYVPLSRGACLRLSRSRGRWLVYRDLDSSSVDVVNQNIAANSVRFIMAPEKQEVGAVVTRSGCEQPYSAPRVSFEKPLENDNESFEMMMVNPRNYFYLPNGLAP